MHCRTICLGSNATRTLARCQWLHLQIPSLLGARFSRCQFTNPSFPLQAPSHEAENGTHNLDCTDSILHGLSSEVDKDIRELLTVKQEEAKDVFIDDLSATLEAHRTTNRATVVRKQRSRANIEIPLAFKRLPIASNIIAVDAPAKDKFTLPEEQGVEVTRKPLGTSRTEDNTKDTGTDLHGENFRVATVTKTVSDRQQVEKPGHSSMRSTNWPADSVQNRRRRGEKYSIGRHEVLEYQAMYIPPGGDYRSMKYATRSCPWVARLGTFTRKPKGVTASRR